MELNNMACRHGALASMDLEKLNRRLQAELQKESRDINETLVNQILDELETREGAPGIQDDAQIKRACDVYRAGCDRSVPNRKTARSWILRVAAIAAVICVLLVAVPVARGESNFLEFVTRIRDDVVAFFNPEQADNRLEYVFQTDHPGLQQLYDAVTELGVTDDVVPMWIPEEYELVELTTQSFPAKTRVHARFSSGNEELLFYYDLYGVATTYEYMKEKTPCDKYERAGIVHEIYTNHEKYTVLWEHENLKCSIVADCQEDRLTEILKSIYMMEDE